MDGLKANNMEIKDLTIADVLKSAEFDKQLRRQMEIEEDTQTRVIKAGITRRTVLDRLRQRGVFNADTLPVLYAQILDKRLQGYSAAERDYIRKVCELAFRRTLKRAIEEEKEENEALKDEKGISEAKK